MSGVFKGSKIPSGLPPGIRRKLEEYDEALTRTKKGSGGVGQVNASAFGESGSQSKASASKSVVFKDLSTTGTINHIPIEPPGTLLVVKLPPAATLTSGGNLVVGFDLVAGSTSDSVALVSDGAIWYEVSRSQAGYPTMIPARIWGAYPDGSADSSGKIQTALNLCPIGWTLFFEPGTYNLQAGVVSNRKINISANGVTFDFGSTEFSGSGLAFCVGDFVSTQISDIFVEGLRIKRTYTASLDPAAAGPGTGIQYTGFCAIACNACTFRDLHVEGFGEGYYLQGRNGITGAGFSENAFYGCKDLNCRHGITLYQTGISAFVTELDFHQHEHQHNTSFSQAHCNNPDYGFIMFRSVWGARGPAINNIRFWGPNFESATPTRAAYRKIICEGREHFFMFGRYENNNTTDVDITIGKRTFVANAIASPGGDFLTFDSEIGNLQKITFTSTSPASALTVGVSYFARNSTGNSCQFSTTSGGAIISPLGSGTIPSACTVGTSNSNMTRNVFFHGNSLQTIVENNYIEFLAEPNPGVNNKNQFFSGWGTIWSGGNVAPAIQLSGGSDTTNLLDLQKVSGTPHTSMRLRAEDPTGESGFIGFYNDADSTILRNYISNMDDAPYSLRVNQGLQVNAAKGATGDFQVFGDILGPGAHSNSLLFVDASANAVAIGTTAPDPDSFLVKDMQSTFLNGSVVISGLAGNPSAFVMADALIVNLELTGSPTFGPAKVEAWGNLFSKSSFLVESQWRLRRTEYTVNSVIDANDLYVVAAPTSPLALTLPTALPSDAFDANRVIIIKNNGTVALSINQHTDNMVCTSADSGTDTFTFTLTGGFTIRNNLILRFPGGSTPPSGVVGNTTYYVVNASGNTCKVSATRGGAAINFGAGGVFPITPTFWETIEKVLSPPIATLGAGQSVWLISDGSVNWEVF